MTTDKYYLECRAEDELELAQTAVHPAAVKAHYLLAAFYLDRLYSPEASVKNDRGCALKSA